MILSRKRFLKIAGLSIAAVSGGRLTGKFVAAMQTVPPGTYKSAKAIRWAMAIDLGKCRQKQGCDICIKACHQSHNVPEFTTQAHKIEWIWKTGYAYAFPTDPDDYQSVEIKNSSVLLFCNHCENPPCVRVCPTQATWKRDDGIVMMDWHRCIGCRYCMAACPYGSRSFNWTDPRNHIAALNPNFPARTKGVVEKCNFCEEKVSEGGSPFCVKSCPQNAMIFGDLNDQDSAIRGLLRTRYTIRRKPELGTNPRVYYLI
jgi:Fe-S-cluster-containing dehydrogenase component